jgi:hypothetical protein
MTQDAEFYEGFDKYGPESNSRVLTINDLAGEWTSWPNLAIATSQPFIGIGQSLAAGGAALRMSATNVNVGTISHQLSKTLAGNFARCIGGVTISSPLLQAGGVVLGDGGQDQVSITVETTGRIAIRTGTLQSSTVLATSIESVSANAAHCIEWDITIHNTLGTFKVYLDGVLTSLSATGQNLRASANNFFNAVSLGLRVTSANSPFITFDHLYCWFFTASGGLETPALTNPIIETQFPSDDDAVQFAFGAGVLGQAKALVTTTSSPGANRLTLRKWTPEVAATLASVAMLAGATSATAKFKGVIFSDSAGAPGALLSSGTEVVGCTSGAQLTLPLVTPQALAAGTQYWIGFINDTSIAIRHYDAGVLGFGAANTYASGAPGTAPAMTAGLVSWMIWGNVTGVAVNWAEVSENPALGDLSFVQSSTVNDEDLFTFPALGSTPTTIYGVAVKANMERTDAGARTIDLRHKSGATTGSGLNAGQTPATTYGWLGSYFRVDPDTLAAFSPSGLNAGKSGYKIAS